MKAALKVGVVVGGCVVLVAATMVGATAGMGEIRKLVINDVDLASMSDGTYTGTYHRNRWTYDVEVTVAGGKITSVSNTNEKTRMAKGFNEKVSKAIIARQSPRIDAVAGATISSRAFCKAVEDALTKGLKK